MKPLNLTFDARSGNLRQLLVLFVITICIVLSRKTAPAAEPLYKEMHDINPQFFQLRLIPYYAWSNRGVSQMTVWVPVD
jgi:DUF1680 family protein